MAAYVALICVPNAWAWTVAKSSNGLLLSRESTDSTASVGVKVYSGYRGGSSWVPAFPPKSGSSYSAETVSLDVYGLEVFEVPLVRDGGRCQMVFVSNPSRSYAVLYEPLLVDVEGMPEVSVSELPTVSVVGTVAVSKLPTASVVGTVAVSAIPSLTLESSSVVSTVTVAGLDTGAIQASSYLLAMMSGLGVLWWGMRRDV